MINAQDLLFTPSAGNHFLVTLFLYSGDIVGSALPAPRVPSPLDLRFQRVSGLGRSLNVTKHQQGGDNVSSIDLPDHIQHERLVLERGVMAVTPFSLAFSNMLTSGEAFRCDIIIMLLDHKAMPLANWCVMGAVPVGWSTGELDASTSSTVINRFEFSYSRIQHLGIKL